MPNKIAFNPQDRFLVAMGNTLIVTTKNGDTFGHDVSGSIIGPAFQFTGAKAAFNPQDRFVTTMGNTLIVCTKNGDTFGHDVSGRNIGPAFQFSGAKAAFNPGDRFVVTIEKKLIVCTQNGDTFGHDIVGRNIGPAFQFTGSKAAFNAVDRFVVTNGNQLIVTTQNGDVFGHNVLGRFISVAFKFTGSRMAFNPQDRFVTVLNGAMVVTTQNGDAFGADIEGMNIDPIYWMNPDRSLRLHLKVWTNPTIAIATMLKRMREIYSTAGIGIVVGSTQDLTGTNIITSLRDLDVVANCPAGQLTGEQIQLFNNRDNVGPLDVAIHFVRSTIPVLNGCASHPDDCFGAVVTQGASVWTLAHETGHVMGLVHISGENTGCPKSNPGCCSTPDPTRLMTGCSTSNIVGTPTISQSEIDALRKSSITRPS